MDRENEDVDAEEQIGVWAPEGKYIEWDSSYDQHKFSNKQLSDLSFVPSKLVSTIYPNKKLIMVASLRKEVCWHVDHSASPSGRLTYDPQASEHATCIALSGGDVAEPKILIGFTNGEVVMHNTITKKSEWFNFDCEVCESPVSSILWITPTRFVSTHLNDDLYEYDITFTTVTRLKKDGKVMGEVTLTKSKKSNTNPIKRWTIGKPPVDVTALAMNSVDTRMLACGDKRGNLTIINIRDDVVEDRIQLQTFGAVCAVAWSADGRYIAGGGQDDLVKVYSVEEKRKVATGSGHSSYVMAIRFDPFARSSPRDCYRVVSVGQDGNLFFWELNPTKLSKPPLTSNTSNNTSNNNNNSSMATTSTSTAPTLTQTDTNATTNHHYNINNNSDKNSFATAHAHVATAQPSNISRAATKHAKGKGGKSSVASRPLMPPHLIETDGFVSLGNATLHNDPITDVTVLSNCIATICTAGIIKCWKRPVPMISTRV